MGRDISLFNASMALGLKVRDRDVAINTLWKTVIESRRIVFSAFF
jgi:hypothetical protein